MPELPDVVLYLEALERRIVGETLNRVKLASPFILRTAVPSIDSVAGKRVMALRRLGKRIVIALEGELFLVLHLMIAGRLRWLDPAARGPGRITLAVFEFSHGSLVLTEAGTKRRAALHLVADEAALRAFDAGGLDVFQTDLAAFSERLRAQNHTVKRALTDPRLFSGIGNAYSDEILHRARLSPLVLTQRLTTEEVARVYEATRATMSEWIERLRREGGDRFPEKVTAFRAGMAVHGRYGKPCPVCGTKVARIVFAENETNYCPRCQTGGRLLADRSLSRLLHKSWPKTIEELE
jgi:formamidopyrimidine-DNA glycosylase